MKKVLKFSITLAIGFFIFWLVLKRVGLNSLNEALSLFLSFKGLIIIALTFVTALIGVLKWKSILASYGFKPPSKELIGLWLVDFGVSYLTPVSISGGEAIRIYFTKKKFNIPWEKSAAAAIVDKILDATLLLMFVIVGLLFFVFYGHFPSGIMLTLVLLMIGGVSGLLLLFYSKALNRESVLEWFFKFLGIKKEKIKNSEKGKIIFDTEKEIIKFFNLKRKDFWKALGLSYLRYFLLFFRTALLIFFVIEGIGISKALAIYGFVNGSLLFPIPAAFGSLEAVSAFGFSSFGLGEASGATFAMVFRSADLVVCLFGLLFLIKHGAEIAEMKILGFFDKFKINK